MKNLILGFLVLGAASTGFAATAPTDMSAKWNCTTNASSSDDAKDKAADEKLSQSSGAAKDSFKMAEENCRDCTKITCEAK